MIAPDALWRVLEDLAPLELAASWDNVGLLVEPHEPRPLDRLLLTIDLTEPVLDDALTWNADAIVAYHPLIFGGLKRISSHDRIGRLVARLLDRGLPVYSPHSALDASASGMNDWLIEALGEVQERTVLEPSVARPTDPTVGMGRRGRLLHPLTLDEALSTIKTYLGLTHLRVAPAASHAAGAPIESLAVCPGAGGDLLRGLAETDLLLTGEMGHHDILAANAEGSTVILTDHTNTERSYLPIFAQRLKAALEDQDEVEIRVSPIDRDPLHVV